MQENCESPRALMGSIDTTPSPLEKARRTKKQLMQQMEDVDRLIALLEKNPEIEELLKLSRRFL